MGLKEMLRLGCFCCGRHGTRHFVTHILSPFLPSAGLINITIHFLLLVAASSAVAFINGWKKTDI